MSIRYLIFCLLGLVLSSCVDLGVDCETYDYADCLTEEPQTWDLKVSFTIDSLNPLVKVAVFAGDFEQGDTLYAGWFSESPQYFELPVNEEYSVTASYQVQGKTVLAVDGDKMRTRSTLVCEKKCWKVKGSDLDVGLAKP